MDVRRIYVLPISPIFRRAPSHGGCGAPVVCQPLHVADGLASSRSRAEAVILNVLRKRSRVGRTPDDHYVVHFPAKNDERR